MKRLQLELGGQCPFIVLDDADVAEAAAAAARVAFSNMGQICIAVNRILVADSLHDAFLQALAAETAKMRLGHGVEPGVAYGPVLNESVRSRTRQHVDDALAHGGRLIAGGAAPTGEAYERGFFFNPTLIDGADDRALVMTEESYGPIAAIGGCGTTQRPSPSPTRRLTGSRPTSIRAILNAPGRLRSGWKAARSASTSTTPANSRRLLAAGSYRAWGVELGSEGIMAYREPRHIRLRLRGGLPG